MRQARRSTREARRKPQPDAPPAAEAGVPVP
jgi:hypothetical protein